MSIKPIFLDETGQEIANILDTIKNNIQYVKGDKGDQGKQGIQGIPGEQGKQGLPGPQGEPGVPGIQGEPGEPFSIFKTYESIAEMNADLVNVPEGKFVLISNDDLEDEDNAKLFVRARNSFNFLVDMSGAPGIEGPQGPQGNPGIQGPQGNPGIQGPKGDNYTITDQDYDAIAEMAKDKVDLTDYVKNTDYATSGKSGVIKEGNGLSVQNTGVVACSTKTVEQYKNNVNGYFISKGTLENIKASYVKEGMASNMTYDEDTETLSIITE